MFLILAFCTVLVINLLLAGAVLNYFAKRYQSCNTSFVYAMGTALMLSGAGIVIMALGLGSFVLGAPYYLGVSIAMLVGIAVNLWLLKARLQTTLKRAFLVFLCLGVVSFVSDFVFKGNIFKSYSVPAGSMVNTLLIGDNFIADHLAYRYSDPKHEDIVLFLYPKDTSKTYVKSCIALPGDVVEIRDKTLFINNEEVLESYVTHADAKVLDSERDNFGPYTVPDECYFMLGDNRDHSYDSRFFGCVPRGNILGRAEMIYWSWDKKTHDIRWERIGISLDE